MWSGIRRESGDSTNGILSSVKVIVSGIDRCAIVLTCDVVDDLDDVLIRYICCHVSIIHFLIFLRLAGSVVVCN